ncbi:MAG: hypothetical protein ACLRVU_15350, partial [Beduini sp.]|uniref:hypothetical protein n=1 Tax=Beduini sp. TaxID=1922300 RepID=UPI0039A24209
DPILAARGTNFSSKNFIVLFPPREIYVASFGNVYIPYYRHSRDIPQTMKFPKKVENKSYCLSSNI